MHAAPGPYEPDSAAPPNGADRPGSRIRQARPGDGEEILRLVRALAVYEREPDAVLARAADFEAALFGPDPRAHCLLAEVPSDAGPVVAGLALWFVTFSTWTGRHGVWLEDLFVEPEHRRLGLGRSLLAALAEICVERGWSRLEWTVLDWNEPALAFYQGLGAQAMDEWTTHRVSGSALHDLAHPPTTSGPDDGPT